MPQRPAYADTPLTPDPGQAAAYTDAPLEAHPEARIGAPTPYAPVTLGDLTDSPAESFQRIGRILGRDATDPKLWLTLALSYFGPKVLPEVLPAIGRAMRTTAQKVMPVAGALAESGPDVVGLASPRLANALRIAQRVRTAVADAQPPAAAEMAAPPAAAPVPAPAAAPPAKPVSTPPPPPAPPGVLSNPSAAEMKGYTTLRRSGLSHQAALDWLQTQRELAARPGTPASAAADSGEAAGDAVERGGAAARDRPQRVGHMARRHDAGRLTPAACYRLSRSARRSGRSSSRRTMCKSVSCIWSRRRSMFAAAARVAACSPPTTVATRPTMPRPTPTS